jgi:hypothetical protein
LIHRFSGTSRRKMLRIFGRTTLEIQFIDTQPVSSAHDARAEHRISDCRHYTMLT